MHKITFYPLANADSTLLEIDDNSKEGRLILMDFGNEGTGEDSDKRVDLKPLLRAKLKGRSFFGFDVVAFSHLDKDHICDASNFFYLEYNVKYQSDDRPHIAEMWVPAAVLTEDVPVEEEEERIIQKEARYRFKNKQGIRVFSSPNQLNDWMTKEKLSLEGRSDLLVAAGKMVPGYEDKTTDGVEIFVHNPFAHSQDKRDRINRNDDGLVLHATFHTPGHYGGRDTHVLLTADVTQGVIAEIVNITRTKENEERLKWDILKLPHHCSYKSLAPEGEKGEKETVPVDEVKWLLEQGQNKGRIISTSEPIGDTDQTQPPHFQAANTYRKYATAIKGEFLVTMQEPSRDKPEPMTFKIDGSGATPERTSISGATKIVSSVAPRVGADE